MWVWSFLFGNLKRALRVVAALWLLAVVVIGLGGTWLTHNPEAIEGAAMAVADRLEEGEMLRKDLAEDDQLSVHQRRARQAEEAAREAWERESYGTSDDY